MNEYDISCDPERLDLDAIHAFLSRSKASHARSWHGRVMERHGPDVYRVPRAAC